MSIPYLPLYVADYDADTAHLTMEEDGVYMRLLRLCWRTPGYAFPADKRYIMRRIRVDQATYDRVVSVVLCEMFRFDDGFYRSDKITEWVDRARKTETRPWIPLVVQRHVFERDGSVCKYCGDTEGPFHLDHIHPWALGGTHDPENLTVACARCNWSKGGKTVAEWRGF
jgi:hypothetical protein